MRCRLFPQWSLLLFFSVFSNLLFAEPEGAFSISGRIIDKETKSAIEYATIAVYNAADSSLISGTITDAKGEYKISKLKQGNYYLVAKFIGYNDVIKSNINLQEKVYKAEPIELQKSTISLGEVQVVQERRVVDYKVDKKVINVAQHLSAEGGFAVDALQNIPSIKVDGDGNVTLRGSTSFTVLVDGKPSVIEGNELLKQIPASSIEKIEVITNPSAKYEAKGMGGIINLITKRNTLKGFNGLATSMFATGNKYNGSMLFNYRKGKVNTNIGTEYSAREQNTEDGADREIYNSLGSNFINRYTERMVMRKTASVTAAIDYDINRNNLVSINAKYGSWQFERELDTKYKNWYSYQEVNVFQRNTEAFNTRNDYWNTNFNYKHQFNKRGHELVANFLYTHYDNTRPNSIVQQLTDVNSLPINSLPIKQQISNYAVLDNYELKLDYTLPLNDKTTIELGGKSEIHPTKTSYRFNNYNYLQSSWEQDNDRSGDFKFRNNIYALYANLNASVSKVEFKLGSRLEYDDYTLTLLKNNQEISASKLHVFPTIHISKKLTESQEMQLSYSRRINRPDEWELNPFPYSSDNFVIRRGNPDLKPGLSDSYELNYNISGKQDMLSTSLFYRKNKNAIMSTFSEENGDYIETYENIQKEEAAGLEMMGNVNPLKWSQLNLAGNLYYYGLKGTLSNGYETSQKTLTWDATFTSTFKFHKNTQLQFIAIYEAPTISAQGDVKSFYYFDFILKQYLFKRNGSITLRTHNTFDTGNYKQTISGKNFVDRSFYHYEGPVVMLTLSFKFNNYQQKNYDQNMKMNFNSGLDH